MAVGILTTLRDGTHFLLNMAICCEAPRAFLLVARVATIIMRT